MRTSLLGMAVHTTLSDSIRRQRSADEQMPFVQEGASRHGADGHANHLAAMMWQWRRPDEMALSRKPLSNGSKTGLLERQFDRVINHARFRIIRVLLRKRFLESKQTNKVSRSINHP